MFINPIPYVINLEERGDKLNYFKSQIERSNIPKYRRIKAIKGINDQIIKRFKLDFDYSKLNEGEIGCFCSHVATWLSILQSKKNKLQNESQNESQYYLIMEDDVVLPPNLYEKLSIISSQFKQLLKQNQMNGILYLGGRTDIKSLESSYLEEELKRPSPYFQKADYKIHNNANTVDIIECHELVFMGAFSYCISIESIKRMLENLQSTKITKPIDLYMTIFHHHYHKLAQSQSHSLGLFYLKPLLTIAKTDFGSDIEDNNNRY